MKEVIPPKWITRFFRWFCNPELVETIEGDLVEQYYKLVKARGARRAKYYYFFNVLSFFQPYVIRRTIKSNSYLTTIDMFGNYFKIGIRNLIRHKGISSIKIFGLSVGMACTILILIYVEQQLSYDQNQLKKDNIVRLESETWVVMPPYLREAAMDFPEVEEAIRFFFWFEPSIRYHERVFTVDNFGLVDPSIFKVFNFEFIAGSAENAFALPNSIVLTKSVANKLFGDEDPLGKSVIIGEPDSYLVGGVIDDVEKFHMEVNGFMSVEDFIRSPGNEEFLKSRSNNHSIYLLLTANINRQDLIAKINERAINEFEYGGDPLTLRDFNEIYFANNLSYEKNTKHGNIGIVITFSIIATLILLIACINFINLTIAKTKTREREIAIRKVSGASKKTLQVQFFGETLIIVLISSSFAILLTFLFLPTFNILVAENLILLPISQNMIIVILGVLLFTVLVSGIYPSVYLANANVIAILKGKSGKGSGSSILSKLLISFQYAVSIFLIIATITVVRQLNFMQNKELGINHDYVLTCTVKGEVFSGEADKLLATKAAFRQQLISDPNVIGVTFLNQLPGKITNTYSFGLTEEDEAIPFRVINADPDFIELMSIAVKDGRNFSYELQSDLGRRIIINEEAVKQLGLENPVGASIFLGNTKIEIIGVVKDFHFNSLHSKIEPAAIVWDYWTKRACIKLTGVDLPESIAGVESVFKEFSPGIGFEYDFLDQTFAKQYKNDKKLRNIVSYFVGLAILLSSLGLFALTAFIAEQKTKEIGIRKVLGSSNSGIILLLSNSFTKWIIIANIVSWPVAYFLLFNWLEDFNYRINLGIGVFLIGGLVAFLIAFITMSYQGIKSARINPVESLKYD